MDRDVIAFAKGESSFEHVHRLIDAIKPGFEKHGYLCVDFDTSERSSYDDLLRLVNENRVRLLFSMNMAMNTILLNKEWLKETCVFLYMLDHPYLVYPNCDKLVRSFADVHLSYCGLTQVRFAQRLHPGAARIHCLPHGAVPRDVIPWKERDIPVFFVGNNELDENPEIFRAAWREYGAEKMRNLNAMVEICLRNPRCALEDAAVSVLGETSEIIELCAYMGVIDRYLRGKIRWQVLERLSRQSADVHVFGKGWEELSGHEESRLVCHGPAPNKDVIEMMRRAKIVLNLSRLITKAMSGSPMERRSAVLSSPPFRTTTLRNSPVSPCAFSKRRTVWLMASANGFRAQRTPKSTPCAPIKSSSPIIPGSAGASRSLKQSGRRPKSPRSAPDGVQEILSRRGTGFRFHKDRLGA